MLQRLCRSARRQALTLRLNEFSICWILHKDLHYQPYKIQVAQELSERDKVSRLQFCNELYDFLKNINDIVNTLLLSDEAHTIHMNFTNIFCIVHQWQVWHAVPSRGIIGPFCFENAEGCTITVNAEWYIVILETLLRIELHPCQQDLLCFQQDGATAHTAQISMQFLRTLFLGRHISCFGDITWPACSPDLAVPDYFLWGYL